MSRAVYTIPYWSAGGRIGYYCARKGSPEGALTLQKIPDFRVLSSGKNP